MTKNKSMGEQPNAHVGAEGEMESPTTIEYPVVRKKFRVTIDLEATLTAGPCGGELPPLRRTCPTLGRLWSDC